MRVLLLSLLLLSACGSQPSRPQDAPEVATFSIAAFDPDTGDLGVAVQSKVFGVGVVVPWVRADVGAVATQALANPRYGPDGLDMLDDGLQAELVVSRLTAADVGRERRQLGLVDARGNAAAFTGKQTLAWAGHHVGEGYCCQGNILAGRKVVTAMAKTFERAEGPLAERMVEALRAGQAAGGDRRGRQSAALLVARRHGGYLGANDRYIDIRVDDHPKPIEELARLLVKRRGFGREASVPRQVANLRREARVAALEAPSARAVWRRWRQLRAAGAWAAVYALTTTTYRDTHDLAALQKAEASTTSPQALAERAIYLGTELDPREGLDVAKLYFDLPRRTEPVMIVMQREGQRWCIIP